MRRVLWYIPEKKDSFVQMYNEKYRFYKCLRRCFIFIFLKLTKTHLQMLDVWEYFWMVEVKNKAGTFLDVLRLNAGLNFLKSVNFILKK